MVGDFFYLFLAACFTFACLLKCHYLQIIMLTERPDLKIIISLPIAISPILLKMTKTPTLVVLLTLVLFTLYSCDGKNYNLDSLEGMNAAIKANPTDTAARFARARYYQTKGKTDSALADIQVLLKTDSTNMHYFLTAADLYLMSNKTRYTRQALLRAVSLNSEMVEPHMKLAELYLYVQMRQEAINELNEVLKRNVNNPKAYYLKGMIYKESGDTALAISSFLTTTEQDKNYALAYEQLGLIYANRGDKRCVDFYQNALRINPSNSLTRYNLGYFYQLQADTSNALKEFREITRLDPRFPYAPYNIGFIIFEMQGNPKAALPYFLQAISAKPDYYEAVYMSGLCNEKMGNSDLAKRDYEQALKINPNYELAQTAMARLKK
jgi:tetratricopeptide (TPR) repeat protein